MRCGISLEKSKDSGRFEAKRDNGGITPGRPAQRPDATVIRRLPAKRCIIVSVSRRSSFTIRQLLDDVPLD